MFPYKSCVEWLRDQAQHLEASGYKVEIVDNEVQLPTFALKISSGLFLAEFVIWQYGRSSMQVFDLNKGKFILENHDMDLSANAFQSETQIFFDLLKPRLK